MSVPILDYFLGVVAVWRVDIINTTCWLTWVLHGNNLMIFNIQGSLNAMDLDLWVLTQCPQVTPCCPELACLWTVPRAGHAHAAHCNGMCLGRRAINLAWLEAWWAYFGFFSRFRFWHLEAHCNAIVEKCINILPTLLLLKGYERSIWDSWMAQLCQLVMMPKHFNWRDG